MKSILVTGGCGYIGSHTVLSLLENGYFVYVIDSNVNSSSAVLNKISEILSKGDENLSKNLKFYKGDIRL